jgi:phosphomannomutase
MKTTMLVIFDVDGTLTPSRGRIDEQFRLWLLNDMTLPFVLITGSDAPKTREQIGDELYNSTTVYNCTGNHIFDRGVEQYKSSWRISEVVEHLLQRELGLSDWPIKTGKHIEHRVGMCNFSLVGRNATLDQRKAYYQHDQKTNDRIRIAQMIMAECSDTEASVAGETGIDIYQRGTGKDQLIKYVASETPLIFFGDRMDPAGNDYSLAQAITAGNLGKSHAVQHWQETWDILRSMVGK